MDSVIGMVEDRSLAIATSTKPRAGLLAALRRPSTISSDSSAESEDDLSISDQERPAKAPRDTASSQPQYRLRASKDDEEDDSDPDAAYERMKKRLAATKAREQTNKPPKEDEGTPLAATMISSEDEDEMPLRRDVRTTSMRRPNRDSPHPPSTRSRQSSPGLFVTPNATPVKTRVTQDSDSESDQSTRSRRNADLQERIQRIRAERLAKEREQLKQQKTIKSSARPREKESDSGSDDENGRRLTQQAKPTRKAGKKAMELMARDQQRISRNMQLTHQAKTKKRFGLADLYSRFGYNAPLGQGPGAESLPTRDASSTLVSSDVDASQTHDTPPTSPPRQEPSTNEATAKSPGTPKVTVVEEPTSLPTKVDKGKGRASEFQHLPPRPWETRIQPSTVQEAQLAPVEQTDHAMVELSDSDDDLEVVPPKNRFPVFDRIPIKKQQESSSLLHLRHLAHLTSSREPRKGSKSISLAAMQLSLAQKAREQAQREREEKIAELKRRGIHIETEEEREKNEMEIEDMVAQFEKQRQEDLRLAKAERAEAKKNGETADGLPSSDESDYDYVDNGEEDMKEVEEGEGEENIEFELSGSEDEDEEPEADGDTSNEENFKGLVAEMADESDGEPGVAAREQQVDEDADMEEEDLGVPTRKRTATRQRKIVVEEDDESDGETLQSADPTQPATQDDAMAAFGFGNVDAGLGLTQMFAGTMANLESDSQAALAEPEQDSLDFLRGLPDTQPGANFSQASDFMIPNSQSLMSPQKEADAGMESQFDLGISQLVKASPAFPRTQLEDLPEPTQDAGFSFSRSPAGLLAPISTVDTVMLSAAESPIKQKKGRLHRGRPSEVAQLSEPEDLAEVEGDFSEEDDIQRPPKPRNAFAKLQKAAKKQKAIDEFNKKTSLARDAVMDQAEESEDEYAGLGGASDDDSGIEDEDMKNMIEHGEVDVDEREIAAFFADKAKKEDEKNINELYKNVMNGGLRRRAGGRDGFNLSDSEDEEDMCLRKKRAEFQKMNRALLADERIGNIAKDQKKQAFFHTLADFADEGEYEFLDMPADLGIDGEQSQSQGDAPKGNEGGDDVTIPDSQMTDAVSMPAPNVLKRKLASDSQKENRPPPNLRRAAAADNLTRKPITLADVQHSVSELLEDPRIIVPDSQYSESEDEDDSPTLHAASRKPIIDRLTLSRTSSMSEAVADGGNLAFHAPSRSNTAPGFRVPSLIRQATSNLSATSDSRRSSSASTSTETVRRGGTGKSNIHAQAREAERRQLLEKKESKRKEALKRKVNAGRKGGMRSVLGDLGGGFE